MRDIACPAILLHDASELFRLKEVISFATNAVIRSQDGHNPSQGIENSIRENTVARDRPSGCAHYPRLVSNNPKVSFGFIRLKRAMPDETGHYWEETLSLYFSA